jgi:hypothetical protein
VLRTCFPNSDPALFAKRAGEGMSFGQLFESRLPLKNKSAFWRFCNF